MAIRKFKPATPGTRNMAISAFDEITAKKPYKALLEPLKRTGGRNNTGKMTVRNRGGGHKRMYRIIDFLRDKDNMKATVKTIEYDPNRSARIALVEYEDGEKRYIIAPAGIKVGQIIVERTTMMEGWNPAFTVYAAVLLTYFVICSTLSWFGRWLERRLKRDRAQTSSGVAPLAQPATQLP